MRKQLVALDNLCLRHAGAVRFLSVLFMMAIVLAISIGMSHPAYAVSTPPPPINPLPATPPNGTGMEVIGAYVARAFGMLFWVIGLVAAIVAVVLVLVGLYHIAKLNKKKVGEAFGFAFIAAIVAGASYGGFTAIFNATANTFNTLFQ